MDYKLFMQKTLRPGKDENKHEPPDKDGNERSYYYDDAHGYETYIQGDEDDLLDASPIDPCVVTRHEGAG